MKIYYLPYTENIPAERRGDIVQANYDDMDFKWLDTTNNAIIKLVDEMDPENKAFCIDVQRYATMGKYYIGEDGGIYEVAGWEPPAVII